MHVERNPFLITVAARFATDQQRGKVVTARFRRGWDGVWRNAIPGRNHCVDPLLQRFCAEVGPPRERGNDDVCVVTGWRVYAHPDITHKDQRTNVGAGQIVFAQHRAARFHQLINALRNRETIDFG
ncbi:hypothetical protein D3C76_1331540 [compost metagenome]